MAKWRENRTFDELKEYQIRTVSLMSQNDVDEKGVEELLDYLPEKVDPYLLSELDDESLEETTVTGIKLRQHFSKAEWHEVAVFQMLQDEKVIKSGIGILRNKSHYWLFEPCIEKMFELNQNELDELYSYLYDFLESEYAAALYQHTCSLRKSLKTWNPNERSSESFEKGIDIYRSCIGIVERGFPNFLAMKRILDGENPDNEILQRKSASSVRRELTDTTKELNSAYFDLVVNRFDVSLRNGISHGDVLYDPTNEEVRIPTENTTYTQENSMK
jgi:hypothetical protein